MSVSAVFGGPPDPFMEQGLHKEWFATGSGPVAVAAGSSMRFLITNPADSKVLLLLHRLRIHATTASEFVAIRINPTTNLPTGVVASLNRFLGGPLGKAVVTADTAASAMSGGTLAPYQIPVQAAQFTFTEFIVHPSLIVPPTAAIGVNLANTAGGPTQVTMLLDWREIQA